MHMQSWKQYKKMLIALLAITCCSCYGDPDIKLPPQQSKLVVHAYVGTGDYFSLAVTKSSTSTGVIPSDYYNYIRNAQVVLFENGVAKDTLRYDSTKERYVSARVIAVTGRTYKITVTDAGFDGVE